MIAKCQCQNCGKSVEFDADQLDRAGSTSNRVLGQVIECPHCGKSTQLYLNLAEFVAPPAPKPPVSRMITCADCGAPMSQRALWCPACGSIQRSLFGLLWKISAAWGLVWLLFAALGWFILKLIEAAFTAWQ